MCVVRQEKVPKLQTACTTQIAEGQVFFTDTPEVVQARKATLQLLLGNHPLDCPVCDAGGECELQDMTFKYGAADSFYAEPKNHREEQKWSPVVYFDRPRCILCYRCVRVCGEGHGRLRAGGGEPRLVVHHRAQRAGAAHARQSRRTWTASSAACASTSARWAR